jgi:hypothetical protein
VRSIPPPGQSIDAYPASVLTETQLDIRENAKLLAQFNSDKKVISDLVEKHLSAAPAFWAAHFGLNPQEGMVTAVDSSGNALKPALFKLKADGTLDGLTPKQKLAIADEVMNYANPSAAEHNVRKESVLVVIGALPQKYNIETKITNLTTTIKNLAEKVIYEVEGKPDPDSYKIYFEGAEKLPIDKIQVDQRPGYAAPNVWQRNWGYTTLRHTQTGNHFSNYQIKGDLVRNKTNTYALNQAAWADVNNTSINYYVEGIQQFYFNAYSKGPQHFWQTVAAHRLMAEFDSKYSRSWLVVKLVKVNPNTGAPMGRGVPVAAAPYNQYPSDTYRLVSEVQQTMFPDVPIAEPGKNPKVLTDTTNYYAKELLEAQQIWKSSYQKEKTPVVSIVMQDWKMPISTYGPSHVRQTYKSLTYYRGMPYSVGSPLREKQVAAVGPISKLPVKPIAVMRILYYLQAPGTEEAMERLLIGTEIRPSAPEIWYAEKKPSQEHYNKVVKGVYAILDNPWIYMRARNDLFTYKARLPPPAEAQQTQTLNEYEAHLTAEEIFGNYYNDVFDFEYIRPASDGIEWQKKFGRKPVGDTELATLLTDIKRVFEIARWPTIAPTKLFSAPVNDEQDLLFVRTKMNQALEGPDYPKPREMYLPETLNRKLNADGTFSNGAGPTYEGDTSRYFYNKEHVWYHSRYSANGVTIRTRRRVGKIQPMVDLVSKSQVARSEMGSLNDLDMAGTVGIVGGVAALVAVGLALNRRRSRY